MVIKLMQGQFNANEATEIITQMIQVKIKYHENKISGTSNEEDIKSREMKIKRLQKELFEAKESLLSKKENVTVDAVINISI